MTGSHEQTLERNGGDEGGASKDGPVARKKKRNSLPSTKPVVAGDNAYPNRRSPREKVRMQSVTRKTRLAIARMKGQLDDGLSEQLPEDSIVTLLVPTTTTQTIDQDIERVVGLYFTLANFTKVIKKHNRSQSYTLSSDHAIEIVNFFFGTVFHPSGAKMVDLMVKECSKSDDWKGVEPSQSQIHIVHKAEEFMSEKTKKSRLRSLRSLELSIDFYEAYDRGCQLLKGDNPDADLIAYMKEEGFGPATGVTVKSRFHSMIAKQFKIDSKTIPKKVLGGSFLYHLVLSFDPGVLLLLHDNALRL